MTHIEVIDYLSEHLETSKAEMRRLMEQSTSVITQILDREYAITLPRLGTFNTKKRQKRRGFHPRRKQFMMLPQRRVVSFRAGTSLRNHVKNMRVGK